MAGPSWRVGAFAERFPQEARDFGRLYALEACASDMLYGSAGMARPGSISDASCGVTCGPYPVDMPPGCCAVTACGRSAIDTCCDRGTCCGCGQGSDFDELYPEFDKASDAAHARAAAARDILADQDVADVAAAMAELTGMSDDELVQLYAPQVPAKPLPSGDPAPARCPICGAAVCPVCQCTCECCDSAIENEEPAAVAAE